MAPVRVPIAAGDNCASEARLADAHACREREEALCWRVVRGGGNFGTFFWLARTFFFTIKGREVGNG